MATQFERALLFYKDKVKQTITSLVVVSSFGIAASAEAAGAANLAYGVTGTNAVYEIDLDAGTTIKVGNTGLTGKSNSFAYDSARNEFFFIGPSPGNNLYYWDRKLNQSFLVATASQLGLSGQLQPENASYYGNAYWFFEDGTNILHRVRFNYIAGVTPTFKDVTHFAIAGAPTIDNDFGDIAIDKNGKLFASTTRPSCIAPPGAPPCTYSSYFYTVDLTTLVEPGEPTGTGSGAAVVIKDKFAAVKNPSLQLSFNSDYSKLYGQNAISAKWYTVNTTTGDVSEVAGFLTEIAPEDRTSLFPDFAGFRDIGGSANTTIPDQPDLPEVIANDDTYKTLVNTPVTEDISVNDTVPQNSTFTRTSEPSNGTITSFNSQTGVFTYTPNLGFTGTDTFTYKLCLPAPNTSVCDDAKVTITIEPCNFNTLTQGGWPNKAHVARLDGLFGAPVVIGAKDVFSYTFENGNAVRTYLPSGGEPAVITKTLTNPPKEKNTLAGQLLTLTLNARANPLLGIALFNPVKLSYATAAYFSLHKINDVTDLLNRANAVIGQKTTASKSELSLLTQALEAVTLSWHEGKQSSSSVLACGK